jgi:hypothetical protein
LRSFIHEGFQRAKIPSYKIFRDLFDRF